MSGDLFVRVDDAGRYQPYVTDGLHRADVGQPFGTPRLAIDFCNGSETPATRSAQEYPPIPGRSGRPGASPSRLVTPAETS